MDEFNTPLGLKHNNISATKLPLFGVFAAVLTVILAGLGAYWYFLPGEESVSNQQEAKNSVSSPATDPEISKTPLRNTSQSSGRTFTQSNPDKPGRLDELAPRGELIEPRITFIKPTSSGPDRLSTRPDPTLIEKSSFGLLPRISQSGARPMDVYARPVPATGSIRIAIVIGGFGLSQSGTKSAIELLPADVTLAFAPYGNSLKRWMKKARDNGHELLMQVPMEPIGYPQINPGKNTLVSDLDPAENIQSLYWSMARMTNYVGMMNYLGAKMNVDTEALRPPLAEIAKRGLLYIDDGSTFSSKAGDVAKELSLPFAQGNIVIDDGRTGRIIDKNLQALEKLARRNGRAIGIASAFPLSVRKIANWIKSAKKRGIEIVPISALVR